MMLRVAIVAVLSLASIACDNPARLTNPTTPSRSFIDSSNNYPTLPGVPYSGAATKASPDGSPPLEAITCPTSTTVNQNGSTVVVGPLVLEGECHNIRMPVGEMTIGAAGAIETRNSGTYTVSCGTYTYTATGTLVGRALRLSMNAISQECPNFILTAELVSQ